MRIGEIAQLTGLSVSNIRFYEKKGLIGPQREDGSKYRNYTEDDLRSLKKIVLYRKMDFPIEVIQQLQNSQIDVGDAFEQQLIDLKKKEKMIQGAIGLCEKMIDDGAYEDIDVEYYSNYVKEEESRGNIFAMVDDVIQDFADYTYFYRTGWNVFPFMYSSRGMKYIWCALFVLTPIIIMIDDVLDGDGVSVVLMIFCIGWMMVVLYNIIRFLQYRREA